MNKMRYTIPLIEEYETIFNVRSFGAKGNGVTDDTAAIQAAVDAAFNAGGGIVFVPEGTYLTSYTLTLPSKITLLGAGKDVSVIKRSTGGIAGAGRVLENKNYGGAEPWDSNIAILNMTVQGYYQSASPDYEHNHCIGFFNVRYVRVLDCKLLDAGGDGISARNAEYVVFECNEISHCGRNGISPTSGAFVIRNNHISNITGDNGPGTGIDAEPNNTSETLVIEISGNTIDGIPGNAITLADLCTAADGDTMIRATVARNKVSNAYSGIYLKATNSVYAKQIVVRDNEITSITGVGISIENMHIVTIENNYVDASGASGYGINVAADKLKIMGNVVKHSINFSLGDASGKSKNLYIANTIIGYPMVLKNSTKSLVIGNVFLSTTGINIQGASAEANIIEHNDFTASTTPISFTSSGDAGKQRIGTNLGYRTHHYASTAPTTGTWVAGDIVWNAVPTAAGKIGWVCVAGGTPGTWKAFGAIDA